MADNYATIVQDNLNHIFCRMPECIGKNLPGDRGDRFVFDAFGEKCLVEPKGITFGAKEHSSVFGILISLYALNARPDVCITMPLKGRRSMNTTLHALEFPDIPNVLSGNSITHMAAFLKRLQ